jgi:hypothetical protein
VVLETAEERAAVIAEIFPFFEGLDKPEVTFWIGLSLDPSGAWRWDDGAKVEDHPLVWGDRQPIDAGPPVRAFVRVGHLYDSGLVYVPTSVDERRPYLCERAPTP